jgi:hypothetical protein
LGLRRVVASLGPSIPRVQGKARYKRKPVGVGQAASRFLIRSQAENQKGGHLGEDTKTERII